MSEPIRYVVLTEAEDRHHVAVARAVPVTGWLQIVATFPRKHRAEDYAEMENQMVGDFGDDHGVDFRAEDHEPPPNVDEPESAVGRVVEVIESRRAVEMTRTASYTAPSGKPRPAGALVNEILRELPILLEEFPKGPTAKIFAERLCVEEHFVRKAMREMHNDGRAIYAKRRDSPANHLIPLDYDPPIEELTATQEMVFETMKKLADQDGIVRLSKRQIAMQSRCAIPSVQQILDSLERKGRVAGVEKVHGGEIPTTYRVIEMRHLEEAR